MTGAAPASPADASAPARAPTAAPFATAIVPVYNKRAFIEAAAGSVVAAAVAGAETPGDVEVLLVDHQSTDGSREACERLAAAHPQVARVLVQPAGGTISDVRNAGVAAARGGWLVFFDADIVVPADYFRRLRAVAERTGAPVLGCEYALPAETHWSERVWDALHLDFAEGPRHLLWGGNLAVRADALRDAGGWASHLSVGEDTELCARLARRGRRILGTPELKVVHLGNPKSVRDFYRKQVWHGESTLDDPALIRSPMTALVLLFVLGVLAAPVLAMALRDRPLLAAAAALAAVCAAPTAAVLFRIRQTRRAVNPFGGVLLYAVYLAARATAMARWVGRRLGGRRAG